MIITCTHLQFHWLLVWLQQLSWRLKLDSIQHTIPTQLQQAQLPYKLHITTRMLLFPVTHLLTDPQPHPYMVRPWPSMLQVVQVNIPKFLPYPPCKPSNPLRPILVPIQHMAAAVHIRHKLQSPLTPTLPYIQANTQALTATNTSTSVISKQIKIRQEYS